MNKIYTKILMVIVPLILLSGCGTQRIVPITGRKYRVYENLYSDKQMLDVVRPEYVKQFIKYGGESSNIQETKRVRRIATDLIVAAVKYLKTHGYEKELPYYEWDVHLVPAPGFINATCMPGGKILVYEGILPIAYNDGGLAAILGHEIGHAIAHHKAEEWTKTKKKNLWQTLGAVAIGITGAVAGGDTETVTDLATNTIKLSNGIMEFIECKYSRKHEYEADRIGMMLMAMAGYDPREAPKVWERMTELDGDFQMRILSTHPSNKNRMKKMNEKWMPEAMKHYEEALCNNEGLILGPLGLLTLFGDSSESSDDAKSDIKIESEVYLVTATKLNVRSKPTVNSSQIIGSLRNGEKINVFEIKNGWARINLNGKTGYIKKEYITPSK